LGGITLLTTVAFVADIISRIDADSGNAGAFTAALSIGALGVGVLVATMFGLLAGSVAYVYSDKLPDQRLYHLRWSILISSPGLICLLAIIGVWVMNGL